MRNKPAFWNNSKPFYDLKSYWRNTFGANVYKLPLDVGFTCPNRDGTLGTSGCSYCDGRGSRLRKEGSLPTVAQQIAKGKDYYRQARGAHHFIAYFQTFTNTYAPLDTLRKFYDEALAQDMVIGLAIGTRPDCIDADKLSLLAAYAQNYHIWIEYGVQSLHNKTLTAIGRGHSAECFLEAVKKTAGRGIHICAHIILGLPNETKDEMLETARAIAQLPIDGIKIHSLLALRGTPLGDAYLRGEITMMELGKYTTLVSDILELLPPQMVIQRLTADGYKDIFLAPAWAINKLTVLNAIERELLSRGSFQGARFE